MTHDITHDGAVRIITLDSPPGNVLDGKLCRALTREIGTAAADRDAKLLAVRASGKHFSFGASVEEHLPDQAAGMLEAMGDVVRALAGFPYPTLALVQGRCLGGGLEVALACGQVAAEQGAIFAAAEIRLGVFAPAATAFLQSGVPRAVAEDILLSGRDFGAEEALRYGLVSLLVEDGQLDETLETLVRAHYLQRSPASLRIATATLRGAWSAAFNDRLAAQEQTYLDDLLSLHDGSEGIRAFVEKRTPEWKNG